MQYLNISQHCVLALVSKLPMCTFPSRIFITRLTSSTGYAVPFSKIFSMVFAYLSIVQQVDKFHHDKWYPAWWSMPEIMDWVSFPHLRARWCISLYVLAAGITLLNLLKIAAWIKAQWSHTKIQCILSSWCVLCKHAHVIACSWKSATTSRAAQDK